MTAFIDLSATAVEEILFTDKFMLGKAPGFLVVFHSITD